MTNQNEKMSNWQRAKPFHFEKMTTFIESDQIEIKKCQVVIN